VWEPHDEGQIFAPFKANIIQFKYYLARASRRGATLNVALCVVEFGN